MKAEKARLLASGIPEMKSRFPCSIILGKTGNLLPLFSTSLDKVNEKVGVLEDPAHSQPSRTRRT
jgi:hypothetical protein